MLRKDLVLLGGGHTHVLLIKALAMRPIAGVRVTLVSEKPLTPYSGMLPGYVAGHYDLEQTNIDLNALCRKAGVRWIQARCSAIQADEKRLDLNAQPAVFYDVLSVDIGSTPDLRVEGAAKYAVGVKPIAGFQQRWDQLLNSIENNPNDVGAADWGVIGAGAGGVELALAMAHRLRRAPQIRLHLIFRKQRILSGYPNRVVSMVERSLRDYNIQLHPDFSVAAVTADGVESESGDQLALDTSIWCTGAVGPDWLSQSALETTNAGFISVNQQLQSVSHSNVFAVGDIAEIIDDPRPKAGVFAVRQAPHLERNLRHFFSNQSLQPANLQTHYLSLLAMGDKVAVASRNGLSVKGRWVWRWKDAIDQKFMRQFAEMSMSMNTAAAPEDAPTKPMPCGGCGSKLGPDLLTQNLRSLANTGVHEIEDAMVWTPTPGRLAVQSIDGFRSMISDESRFARICVNHSLSDVIAMGAKPTHAQLWLNLGFADPVLQQRDHLRVLQSVSETLVEQGVSLAGGHSSEGLETHLGIVANGEVDPQSVWSKSGAMAGDVIVMSKALGTGLIMAADMQGAAPAPTVEHALNSMLQSNSDAGHELAIVKPTAVTDVTGFGLLGHLIEMLESASAQQGISLSARIDLNAVPILAGALKLAEAGWRSSLYPQLAGLLQRCTHETSADSSLTASERALRTELLIDPQTSGGLLATLSPSAAETLLSKDSRFVTIGVITEHSDTLKAGGLVILQG